jgi:hypothetical protein
MKWVKKEVRSRSSKLADLKLVPARDDESRPALGCPLPTLQERVTKLPALCAELLHPSRCGYERVEVEG